MNIERKGTGTVVALAAACLLVLQSFFGSYALGAGPMQRDIFGNVICTEGNAKAMPGSGHDGGHLPDCCILGCGGAQLLANAPGAADGLAAPFFEAVAIVIALDGSGLPKDRRTPANPRAPPLAA